MLKKQFSSMMKFAKKFIMEAGWDNNPKFNGVFIIGSVASESSDSMSDLDLVVVVNQPPSEALRISDYQRVGCRKAMIGFFQKDASQLNSNVTVIDKIWLDDLQVDISFCTESEVTVYNYQPIIILKSSPVLEGFQPAVRSSKIKRAILEDRLQYDFRILEVHRTRYERWSARKSWINIDLSKLLLAVRDIVLVINGYWRYNSENPYFWKVLDTLEISVPGLLKTIEDIKEMDDRISSKQKLDLIDILINELKKLCSSRGIPLRLYDIGNAYEIFD
jgi:hypothetical protein